MQHAVRPIYPPRQSEGQSYDKLRHRLRVFARGIYQMCIRDRPVYSLPGFLGACAVAAGAYFLSAKKIPPRVVMVPSPEDPFATRCV